MQRCGRAAVLPGWDRVARRVDCEWRVGCSAPAEVAPESRGKAGRGRWFNAASPSSGDRHPQGDMSKYGVDNLAGKGSYI
jgi:hypothetical protein